MKTSAPVESNRKSFTKKSKIRRKSREDSIPSIEEDFIDKILSNRTVKHTVALPLISEVTINGLKELQSDIQSMLSSGKPQTVTSNVTTSTIPSNFQDSSNKKVDRVLPPLTINKSSKKDKEREKEKEKVKEIEKEKEKEKKNKSKSEKLMKEQFIHSLTYNTTNVSHLQYPSSSSFIFLSVRDFQHVLRETLGLAYDSIASRPEVYVFAIGPVEYSKRKGTHPLEQWYFPKTLPQISIAKMRGNDDKEKEYEKEKEGSIANSEVGTARSEIISTRSEGSKSLINESILQFEDNSHNHIENSSVESLSSMDDDDQRIDSLKELSVKEKATIVFENLSEPTEEKRIKKKKRTKNKEKDAEKDKENRPPVTTKAYPDLPHLSLQDLFNFSKLYDPPLISILFETIQEKFILDKESYLKLILIYIRCHPTFCPPLLYLHSIINLTSLDTLEFLGYRKLKNGKVVPIAPMDDEINLIDSLIEEGGGLDDNKGGKMLDNSLDPLLFLLYSTQSFYPLHLNVFQNNEESEPFHYSIRFPLPEIVENNLPISSTGRLKVAINILNSILNFNNKDLGVFDPAMIFNLSLKILDDHALKKFNKKLRDKDREKEREKILTDLNIIPKKNEKEEEEKEKEKEKEDEIVEEYKPIFSGYEDELAIYSNNLRSSIPSDETLKISLLLSYTYINNSTYIYESRVYKNRFLRLVDELITKIGKNSRVISSSLPTNDYNLVDSLLTCLEESKQLNQIDDTEARIEAENNNKNQILLYRASLENKPVFDYLFLLHYAQLKIWKTRAEANLELVLEAQKEIFLLKQQQKKKELEEQQLQQQLQEKNQVQEESVNKRRMTVKRRKTVISQQN